MTDVRQRRIAVIFNPTAGRRHGWRFQATVERLEGQVTLYRTTKPGDATEMASSMVGEGIDVVVAAGGDGTINEVVNGMAGSSLALGIIPLGTANVMAHELGIGTRPDKVAAAINSGKRRRLHLGRVHSADQPGGRLFVLMAGAGFDAQVVADVSSALKRHTGVLAYVVETIGGAMKYPFPKLSVNVDGHAHEAVTAVVCNGPLYGGPFVAAPKADLTKPGFEVRLLLRPGLRNVLRYGAALVMGRLDTLPDALSVLGSKVVIDGPVGAPVQGDGDILAHLPATITVADETVDVLG
ncbi:MAG: diacylglycerol kinase family lipid kinase [Rhodospirillales bacterium]|nr:MAG: diacylglycerol kinase family lipid kinase [Rhodospirillales bacterium]